MTENKNISTAARCDDSSVLKMLSPLTKKGQERLHYNHSLIRNEIIKVEHMPVPSGLLFYLDRKDDDDTPT